MAKKSKPNPTTTTKPRRGSPISRYVSFVMLLVTILVCGFYFYNVIKGFLLPLFLATLLAVMFRPLHEWVSVKCKNRAALAAAISTTAIMLIVLVPLAGLLTLGLYEANQVVRYRKTYLAKFNEVRQELGLRKPFAARLDAIETEMRKLGDAFNEPHSADNSYLGGLIRNARKTITVELRGLEIEGRDAVCDLRADLDDEAVTHGQLLNAQRQIHDELTDLYNQRSDLRDKSGQDRIAAQEANREIDNQIKAKEDELITADDKLAVIAGNLKDARLAYEVLRLREELTKELGLPDLGPEFGKLDRTAEKHSLKYLLSRSWEKPELGFTPLIDAFSAKLDALPPVETETQNEVAPISSWQQRQSFTDLQAEYVELRTALLGGPIWKSFTELVNPSTDQVNEWIAKLFSGGATRWLPSITNTATSLITGLMVGLAVMAVALFYFFMDGPKMVTTFMHLSPLDDRHELELLQEFDKVSRAVVLATLLSALAQGILGGIGYKIVGLNSVFLLTVLTSVLALIPFVGAAAVWLPCCLYVAFLKEPPNPDGLRTWMYIKAAFLAAYGVGVVSMADNFIKPWVLQGQSKLHPLLALLSVLGGVQALGPIGILIGPMVVAFFQVLLTILQSEITSLDQELKTDT